MFKNIVIATQSTHGLEAALERATQIEHVSEAEVTVVDVIWDHFAEEPDHVIPANEKKRLVDHYMAYEQQALDRVLKPYQSKIETLDSSVHWAKRFEESIASEVKALGADLVIKSVTEGSRGLRDWISTPTDWRLMRNLSIPVLYCQTSSWRKPYRVLAAVDVTEHHGEVTACILDCAGRFGDVFDCDIDLVTTFAPVADHAHATLVADYDVVRGTMRSMRHRELQTIAAGMDRDTTLHVLEGHVGPTIENLARDIGATVTIVGTAARRGLGKLLLGNTAEQIIAHTTGDLVTVNVVEA